MATSKRSGEGASDREHPTEHTPAYEVFLAERQAEEAQREILAARRAAQDEIQSRLDACTEHSGRWPDGRGKQLARGLVERWADLARAIRRGANILGPMSRIIIRSDETVRLQRPDGKPMGVCPEELVAIEVPTDLDILRRSCLEYVRVSFGRVLNAPGDEDVRNRIARELGDLLQKEHEQIAQYTLYFRLLRQQLRRRFTAC